MRIWEAIYKTPQIHNYKKKLRGSRTLMGFLSNEVYE